MPTISFREMIIFNYARFMKKNMHAESALRAYWKDEKPGD